MRTRVRAFVLNREKSEKRPDLVIAELDMLIRVKHCGHRPE
jgi:hypothetical protein